MAFDFPSSPTLGQTYQVTGGPTYVWNGTAWQVLTPGSRFNRQVYTATAGQTTFNATYLIGGVDVFHNGVKLAPADFTASNGSTVVLVSAANAGDTIEIVSYSQVNYTNAVQKTGDTMTGDLIVNANVGVGTSSPNATGWGRALTLNSASSANAAVELTENGTLRGYISHTVGGGLNVYAAAGQFLALGSGASERVRIDASGNVGIGTNSPNAAFKLDINGAARFTTGATINGGNNLALIESSGNNAWRIANTANDLTFVYNSTERARLMGSGSLCIGTTSSGGGYLLRVDGTTGAYISTVNNTAIYGYGSNNGIGVQGQSVNNYGVYAVATNNYGAYFSSTNYHGSFSQGLYYGLYGQTTSSSYGGVIGFSANGSYYGICGYANYYSFYGNGNASITNGTWGTSDIRFKEVVDDNPFAVGGPYDRSALDIVTSIPVRAYKLKGPMADTSINGVDQFGWIAQEVEAVLPLAVAETPIPPNDTKTRAWIAEVPVPEKDSDAEKALIARDDLRYKSLNKDYLIAALWGAVQELKTELDAAKARIAQLEGTN